MSQLVATINGRRVYSDKKMSSIVNSRVEFADGSWCDVGSGRIVNNGPGYISFDSSEGSATVEKVTEGPKIYSASNLQVLDVAADLDVRVGESGSEIEVTIVGPANEVKAIHVSQRGDIVVVEGDGGSGSGSGVTIISSGRGSSVSVRGGRISGVFQQGSNIFGSQISIGGTDDELQTKITIKVPRGASVNLAGVSGKSVVGDTEGTLRVAGNNGSISAGRVGNADLGVMGHNDVDVREVNGTLALHIMGSGAIHVENGNVSALSVNVMGSGDAIFEGQAENANLTVMGSGDIRVASIKNFPVRSVMGSGKIRVGNWR